MKIFMSGLIASVFYLALADMKTVKESAVKKKIVAVASDSDSKQKRDASLLSGIYHGPSSIYSNNAYPGGGGNTAILSGAYISARDQNHHDISSNVHHNSAAVHRLGFTPVSSYHGSGHIGLGFTSSSSYTGQGSTHHSGLGLKSSAGSNIATTFGQGGISIGHPHSSALAHGSSGSGISGIGGSSTLGSSYPYYKDLSGSFPSAASYGFRPNHGSGNSYGSGLAEVHNGDHVHNGAQEPVFVISSEPSGLGSSYGTSSISQQGIRDVQSDSYLYPVQQHYFTSYSYGVPIAAVGETFNPKYHSQDSAVKEHGSAYAAGHKGLGHFSFTSKKPQVLHTSISELSLKQPSYSNAPFKPSTFFGVNLEGSAHHNAIGQRYLHSLGVGSDSPGYDYPIPSGPSTNYQKPSYQPSVELQATSVHKPDSSYLPPSNKDSSFSELPSAPGVNYLPPDDTYGSPLSH